MTMLMTDVRWTTSAIKDKLAALDAAMPLASALGGQAHFEGVRRTMHYVLDVGPSPLEGVPGYTESQHRQERTDARRMVSDERYGDWDPAYVLGVHRTFVWLYAGPDGGQVIDPLELV